MFYIYLKMHPNAFGGLTPGPVQEDNNDPPDRIAGLKGERKVSKTKGKGLPNVWRRRPDRPRVCWTDQLLSEAGFVSANLCRLKACPHFCCQVWTGLEAVLHAGGATRLPELAMRR